MIVVFGFNSDSLLSNHIHKRFRFYDVNNWTKILQITNKKSFECFPVLAAAADNAFGPTKSENDNTGLLILNFSARLGTSFEFSFECVSDTFELEHSVMVTFVWFVFLPPIMPRHLVEPQ
ncbi:hypothetical protein BLOT_006220 [Blomia tropicalis]|nr:hypothetical protein BLOT_006220 [Blomia tropicalis]